MSRASSGDVIERKAGNNIYTVLTIVATIATALGIFVLYTRSNTLFGVGLF